jgi:ABC-type Fe3+/spermidine/putrescine transport system ATPase subunit
LKRVGLADAGDRYPVQLSGGMQQRVALARALVIEPSILLLDEPLSALDKNLREDMQVELRLLQQNVGVTTVFVTHDQEEAMTLSDRIAVMRAGRIMQIGTPEEVYRRPTSRFVATFLGTTNIIAATVRGEGPEGTVVEVEETTLGIRREGVPLQSGQTVNVAVRPENLLIKRNSSGVPGTVVDVFYQGHRLIVIFRTRGGQEFRSFTSPDGPSLEKGDEAYASWPASAAGILSD